MGLMNTVQQKYSVIQTARTNTEEQQGNRLGKVRIGYVGGLGQSYKDDTRFFSVEGTLHCYENEIYYKKRNNSFIIPSNQISTNQQVKTRLTVTRILLLGIFSLAAPKRTMAKEASVIITLMDGRQIFFHTSMNTEFEIQRRLMDAISYYRSRQAGIPIPPQFH